MPRTPDRTPGPAIEEELQLEDNGLDPSVIGGITNNAGELKGRDNTGIFNLRSGSGLTESQHENLDTLVHALAETRFTEVVRFTGQVTDVIEWTDSGKTTKVRETNLTRSGGQVSQIVVKQYDGAGALITGQTLTGTVSRTGGQITSIDWVQT